MPTLNANLGFGPALADGRASGPPPPVEALIHHWKLDDTSGDAIDSVGSADLTNNGALQDTVGQYQNGRSAYFDGTDMMEATVPISKNSMTFTCWVRPDDFQNGVQTLMGVNTDPANEDGTRALQLNNTTGTARFRTGYDAGQETVNGVTQLTASKFWFVCGVKDDDAQEIRIYVEGLLENTKDVSSRTYTAAIDTFELGSRFMGSNFLKGWLDDLRYYNYALDATEIMAIYDSCDGIGHYRDLIFWSKLDSPTTARDFSLHAAHVSVQGGPTMQVAGQVNDAADFDGNNDEMYFTNVGLIARMQALAGWTLCFHAEASSFEADEAAIAMLDSVGSSDGFAFYPYHDEGFNALQIWWDNGLFNDAVAYSASGFKHFTWRNETTILSKLFVDGSLLDTINHGARDLSTVDQLSIGSWDSGIEHYAGSIDDVRIYKIELSDADIATVAAMTAP